MKYAASTLTFFDDYYCSAFLDWQLVRKKAAKMVEEMAYKAPELRDRMQYPRSGNSLYHVIPIGSK